MIDVKALAMQVKVVYKENPDQAKIAIGALCLGNQDLANQVIAEIELLLKSDAINEKCLAIRDNINENIISILPQLYPADQLKGYQVNVTLTPKHTENKSLENGVEVVTVTDKWIYETKVTHQSQIKKIETVTNANGPSTGKGHGTEVPIGISNQGFTTWQGFLMGKFPKAGALAKEKNLNARLVVLKLQKDGYLSSDFVLLKSEE